MEYRLRDEKRALLCKGDYIRFTEITKPEKTVLVEIIDIYTAPSFVALEQRLIKAGILVKESSLSIEMREYYSLEAEKKYGVVGIRIGLV